MDYLDLLKEHPFFASLTPSSKDNLSGVLNRACIFEYINYLIANKKTFSLFELDIDNFKFVNDTFGHLVGDKVIVSVANLLVEIFGNKGIVGRYGGDEFVIIFEGNIDYDYVWECGHKITTSINDYKFKELNGKKVTVTCGIARFPTDGKDLTELFETADKAMYRGKTKGRDCFIIYLPEKHANIGLKSRNDVRKSLLLLFQETFEYLNQPENYSKNVHNLLDFLCSHFMFDHTCIQTDNKIIQEAIGPLSRTTNFFPIPLHFVESQMNESGMVVLNNIKNFEKTMPELFKVENEQSIKAQVMMKIKIYKKDFGILRIDTTTTRRIWQNEELALIMTIGNTLARDLYYKGITLDDL